MTLKYRANPIGAQTSATASGTATLTGVLAGDTCFCAISVADSTSLLGITPLVSWLGDTAQKGWQLDAYGTSQGTAGTQTICVALYRLSNAIAGSHPVTITPTGATSYYISMELWSAAALSPGVSPGAASSSSNPVVCLATGVLNNPTQMAITVCGADNTSTAGNLTMPTGFTTIVSTAANANFTTLGVGYAITTNTNSLAPSWSDSVAGDAKQAFVITYNDASSPPLMPQICM